MFKTLIVCILALVPVMTSFAQERGAPIFQDSFDTKDTFAENWVVGKGWAGRIHSSDGKLLLPGGGALQMRRDTPGEFWLEMDITINGLVEGASAEGDAFCGIMIEGLRFTITHQGHYWVASSPEGSAGTGLRGKIADFEVGKPVRFSLIRKAQTDAATYIFRVNGEEVATRIFNLRTTSDGGYAPLEFFSYKVDLSLDNVGLFMLRQGAGDSPNLIFNSGFEHELGGYPPYYSTPAFDPKTIAEIPYEDFLASVSLDDQEAHSGTYSLRLINDGRTRGGAQAIRPWGVGTVQGGAGVFSVWLKADQDDFPVSIGYGARPKTVNVGSEWARYEVVNTDLPKPGVYSPVGLSFKAQGTLWIDDLQAEFISAPTDEELASGQTFASPYKPSELDKSRFGQQSQQAAVRPPQIEVPRLPGDVQPADGLDAWRTHAAKVDAFYSGEHAPTIRTEAYLACDAKNIYIGARCYVRDLDEIAPKGDIFEVNVDPIVSGKKFMQYQFFGYADGSRKDKGLGMDTAWDGEWSNTVELNAAQSSIDYTLTIPFTDLAHPELKAQWIMNLHRYDSATKETVTLMKSAVPSFANPQLWPYVELPEAIIRPYVIGTTSGGYSDSSVMLELANHSSKARDVVVQLVAGDTTLEEGMTLEAGVNHVSFPLSLADPKVTVKLQEHGAPLSHQTLILEKRDPVSMLGRLSFYMQESEAPFRVTTSVANPESLTAVLRCGDLVVRQPASAHFEIALPLADVPTGTHRVSLALIGSDGEPRAQTSADLIKRPYKAGAGQVNHFSRSLMHDGQPVVPFAPFFVIYGKWGMTTEHLDGFAALLEKYGFRFVHILFQSAENTEQENSLTRHFLDVTNAKGIKVILWSKYYGYTDEDFAQTRATLDSPNVITQMVIDEPELGRDSDWTRDFLRRMRSFFPYHPTQMNNTVLGIPNRFADLETDILMVDDYLTNRENRSVLSVVQHADVMWEAGAAAAKPCWYFVVCNNTSLHYREPTYAEQVAQTYGVVAAGCTGLSYFYGWPGTPGNWRAYVQLNEEILALTEVLTSEDVTPQASATGDPNLLRHRTWKHDGALYLITCNIDDTAAGQIDFILPSEFTYAAAAEVMFEDRTIPIHDGRFSQSFGPHERHVYRIALAEPAEKR